METRTRLIAIKLTPSEYEQLQAAANESTNGNLSQLVRNYTMGTLRDYRLLRRLGIFQTVKFFLELNPQWKHYRSQLAHN